MTTSSEWEEERRNLKFQIADLMTANYELVCENEILTEKVKDLDRWIVDLLRAQAE